MSDEDLAGLINLEYQAHSLYPVFQQYLKKYPVIIIKFIDGSSLVIDDIHIKKADISVKLEYFTVHEFTHDTDYLFSSIVSIMRYKSGGSYD